MKDLNSNHLGVIENYLIGTDTQTDKYTDIAITRMNRPQARFIERVVIECRKLKVMIKW